MVHAIGGRTPQGGLVTPERCEITPIQPNGAMI